MRRLYIFLFLILMLSGCKEGESFDAFSNNVISEIKKTISPQEKVKEPKKEEERHKIAVLVPLSGHAANVGRSIADAATLALKETTDSGFDVVIYDTVNTSATAQKAAKQAVTENAEIILGPLFSAQAKAVGQVAKEKKIKVISFSNDKNIAGDGVYILGLMPDQQIQQALKFVSSQSLEGVSAIIPEGQFGNEVKLAVESFAPENGLKIQAITTYNSAEKLFTAQAELIEKAFKKNNVNLLEAPSQIIIIPEGGEKLDRIINALREKGITPKNTQIIGTNMWDNYQTNHIAGLSGAWFTSISRQNFISFSERFKKEHGYEPELIAALGYDAVRLAISLSGGNFSKSFINSQSGFGGVNGTFRFTPIGTNERLFEIRKVSEGKTEVLVPASNKF